MKIAKEYIPYAILGVEILIALIVGLIVLAR